MNRHEMPMGAVGNDTYRWLLTDDEIATIHNSVSTGGAEALDRPLTYNPTGYESHGTEDREIDPRFASSLGQTAITGQSPAFTDAGESLRTVA